MSTTPKPARESRTLRFNSLVAWIVSALAALPSLLSYGFDLLGDPQIAAAVADAIPVKYRAALALVVLIVTQRNRALRMQTSTPIAEKWIATDEPQSPPDVPPTVMGHCDFCHSARTGVAGSVWPWLCATCRRPLKNVVFPKD